MSPLATLATGQHVKRRPDLTYVVVQHHLAGSVEVGVDYTPAEPFDRDLGPGHAAIADVWEVWLNGANIIDLLTESFVDDLQALVEQQIEAGVERTRSGKVKPPKLTEADFVSAGWGPEHVSELVEANERVRGAA